jgi:ATP-grasp domain
MSASGSRRRAAGTAGRRTAVVVDAYSTGARLAPRFHAAGLDVVHVQSSPQPPDFYLRALQREDFVENVVHEGDIESTAARVAAFDPAFVVVGSEPGVLVSDALSERLGLPSNGTALSAARRDKHLMAQALRAAGVRAIEECKTGDAEEAVAWAARRDDWPVVVKPVDSAGTDGVVLCETPDEIRAAFVGMIGRPNALHGSNEQLLVQELLRGTQLFTDSISWDGVHHVSECWRDNKRRVGAAFVYDYEELLDPSGDQQDQVIPYVHSVLDALGVRYGPAHTEVMLTDTGPVLVECGARMHGSVRDDIIDRCTPSHVTVTVDAYLDPPSVARRAATGYALRAASYCVMLISHQEGRIVAEAGMKEVEQLESFAGTISMAGPGDAIAPTIDLFSCPGIIYFIHPDRDVLRRDYERIRELEQTVGMFKLDPLPVTA